MDFVSARRKRIQSLSSNPHSLKGLPAGRGWRPCRGGPFITTTPFPAWRTPRRQSAATPGAPWRVRRRRNRHTPGLGFRFREAARVANFRLTCILLFFLTVPLRQVPGMTTVSFAAEASSLCHGRFSFPRLECELASSNRCIRTGSIRPSRRGTGGQQ
jgi:hypothetical protein